MVDLICLILLAVGLLAGISLWGYTFYIIYQKYNVHRYQFTEYFNQASPDHPSEFNKNINQIADIVAERTRLGLTMADRGSTGAAVRDVNRGLEEIAVQNDPSLAVAQALPKSLKKNQLAMAGLNMLVQNIISKAGSQQAGPGINPGNGSASNIKFDL